MDKITYIKAKYNEIMNNESTQEHLPLLTIMFTAFSYLLKVFDIETLDIYTQLFMHMLQTCAALLAIIIGIKTLKNGKKLRNK